MPVSLDIPALHSLVSSGPVEPLWRSALACAWTLKHGGPLDLPLIGLKTAASFVSTPKRAGEVDPLRPLPGTNGFVGICPDLGPDTLMEGYRRGLHQTSHVLPPKWWSYQRRMLMFFDRIQIEKNLRRKLRQGKYLITFDTAFEQVVSACAEPRRGVISLTWILPEVAAAFARLHAQGRAHSVEVWNEQGELAGGLFGVAVGRIFITESQFNRDRDMAKVAFMTLNRHLQAWGFAFQDVGRGTPHLAAAGGEYVSRETYVDLVARFGTGEHRPGHWQAVPELCRGDWSPEESAGTTRAEALQA
jgi:leucyl/phenylalanyl-tRNA--protein transferase